MIGPCGLGLLLLEVGVAGTLRPKKMALLLFLGPRRGFTGNTGKPHDLHQVSTSPGTLVCPLRSLHRLDGIKAGGTVPVQVNLQHLLDEA